MDEFDDDGIARTATEDEEVAGELHAARFTCPALTMMNRKLLQQHPDGKIPVDLLVLGVTEASHILLSHAARDGAVLGSVAHPACRSAGLRTGTFSNRTLGSTLHGLRQEGGMVAVGTCPLLSPPEVAVATTRAMLSMIQPKGIVVVTEISAQAVAKSSLHGAQHDFYCLGTNATSPAVDAVLELPAGCTVTDMAAAALSAAEARSIPAVAVVSIMQQAFTDVTRKHLSGLAYQVCLAAAACVPDADVSVLQQVACEAQLKTPWEAPRVYL